MLYDAWWSYYGEFAVLGIWGIILVLARRMIFGKLSKNALLDGGEKSRMIRAMTLKFEKSYEVHVEISEDAASGCCAGNGFRSAGWN